MPRVVLVAAAAAAVFAAAGCDPRPSATAPVPQSDIPLIPRAALFGAPNRTQAKISPDGGQIAFLAPHLGQLNVFVMPADGAPENARPITTEAARGVRRYFWAHTGRHILYLQDANGDENWRLIVVEVATGATRALTPEAGVQAEVVGHSPLQPEIVLVALNDRDRAYRDVWRVNLVTGERTRVLRNQDQLSGFVADFENRVRLAERVQPDGAVEIVTLSAEGRAQTALLQIPFEDRQSSRVLGFEADGAHFLMIDSSDRPRAVLLRVNAATGAKDPLGENEIADVTEVWIDPRTGVAEAFAAEYLKPEWRPLTEDARADLAALRAGFEGETRVVSRALDDQRWIVVEEGPLTPQRVHLYNRAAPAGERFRLLFDTRPELAGAPLQPMSTREIPSRDGLTLVSYLTLPAGSAQNGSVRPAAPAPLVLVVHGGPWARDSFGFNPTHQWLANRGYAALSVNFRGSTGIGKAFVNAGNRQWGGKMQEDLLDAAAWAVAQGIAAPDRIAIYGQSFGGYAALAGLAFHPQSYACGASVVGPSNLETLLAAMPATWANERDNIFRRVGDPRTPAGRQLLREQSPLTRAGDIRRPLLIAQGARDVRVPQAESDQIVAAMRRANLPVTYLMFPEEGHGLVRPQNRLAFHAVLEGFLGGCLGGRVQPPGQDFEGALFVAREGADGIAELPAAARPPRAPPAAPRAVAADPAPQLERGPQPVPAPDALTP